MAYQSGAPVEVKDIGDVVELFGTAPHGPPAQLPDRARPWLQHGSGRPAGRSDVIGQDGGSRIVPRHICLT